MDSATALRTSLPSIILQEANELPHCHSARSRASDVVAESILLIIFY